MRFGRLIALQRVSPYISPKGNKYSKWLCICDCGRCSEHHQSTLLRGYTKSCGCLGDESRVTRSVTHGKSKTKVNRAYLKMKERCFNEKDKNFNLYGGRGITICDRWLESFENFLEDMGEPPSLKHSLDRIDVNGNYEPHNCRWATNTQQARNKRKAKNNISGIVGIHIGGSTKRDYRAQWVDRLGVRHSKSFNMDKYGESEALMLAIAARRAGIEDSGNTECSYGVNHGTD